MQRELVAWKEHLKRLTHNQMLSVELVPSTTSVHFFRDILDSNLTCSMVEAPRCSLKPSIETKCTGYTITILFNLCRSYLVYSHVYIYSTGAMSCLYVLNLSEITPKTSRDDLDIFILIWVEGF